MNRLAVNGVPLLQLESYVYRLAVRRAEEDWVVDEEWEA